MADFIVKNRTCELIINLKRRDGSIFDMSGKTVQMGYRIGDGTTKVKDMIIIAPATGGKIKYVFEKIGAVWDLYGPGQLYVEVHVYNITPFNLISSSKVLQFTVRDVIVGP